MQITLLEQQTIKQAVASVDSDAKVYLFGSRADDALRGGDIDLLVISSKISLMDKLDILGDQKIDLVVESDLSGHFARLAVQQGIIL